MLTRSIFEREGANQMSKESYIRCVALFTLLVGILVAFGAVISYHWLPSLLLVIGAFVVSIGCIFLFQLSDNPVLSAIGVSGMSLALGLMIGPLVALYTSIVVIEAVVTTGLIMTLMSVLGIMFPRFFEGWGPYLMAGLTFLLIALFGQAIFIAFGIQAGNTPLINNVLSWGGVLIFTGLVAYDWSRALALPYTLDNAIDASGGLILDAVNIFIRLLQIYAAAQGGSSRKSD